MLFLEAIAISLVELFLILSIYNWYIIPAIERRVIDKWLDEINGGAVDLTQILDEVTSDGAEKVMQMVNHRLLSGTGNLAKVLNNPGDDPAQNAMRFGEGILKDLGLKSPSALMVFKLLNSLGNVDLPADAKGGGGRRLLSAPRAGHGRMSPTTNDRLLSASCSGKSNQNIRRPTLL